MHLTPSRLIAVGFLLVILAGAGLLMLPIASRGEPAGFLDALFTSTSATCVTGLVVRDTFTGWTVFGQLVILALIQLGGLGFMTFITLTSMLLGKRLGLYDRKVLMQSAGNITLDGTAALIRKIIPFTFVFEFAGAALLSIRFIPEFGVLRGIYAAVFHAISAFCNAGFDLMGMRAPFSSLTAYVSDPLVSLTICMLIIIGGLGFLVWRDLVRCRFRWKRLQLHSKLVLTASGILLLGGWLLLLGFEWNASMASLSIPEKLLASFFQSVTPRTAGFNTVDLSKLSDSGNLLTDFLMLIGGSPGSTAGGIKTTTLAVLVLSALASARGRMRVNTFRMSIERETLRQASSILLIYLGMSLTAILAICAIEPFGLKAVTFEVVSAIATVGLSLGLTPQLSSARWSELCSAVLGAPLRAAAGSSHRQDPHRIIRERNRFMKSVLIIGMGRTGRHLASKMQELGNDVMIVDKNPAIIEALSGRFTDSNICDCTNDAIIKALGVDNFDICFVTIGEDFQASLVVTSLLKQFGARMIVSKAKQDIQADLLRKIGADEIVCPEREISEKLAVRYNADNIFDFIPLTADYSIYELPIQAAWIGQTLSGLNVRRKYQINIIAVKHDNEINPNVGPDYRFREGDHIILIGRSNEVFKLAAKM